MNNVKSQMQGAMLVNDLQELLDDYKQQDCKQELLIVVQDLYERLKIAAARANVSVNISGFTKAVDNWIEKGDI